MTLLVGAMVFVAGAVVAAVVGAVVNRFAPEVFDRFFPKPRLRVHVETKREVIYAGTPNWVGSGWVIPGADDPNELGAPPTDTCREWAAWLKPLGAYDGWETEIRVTLVGVGPSSVVVDGVRANIISRRPATGIGVSCRTGGADITPRGIEINLDWDPGVVTFPQDQGHGLMISLAAGEVERLHLLATSQDRVQWTAELDLIVDGKRKTVVLDDDGEPFRTCAQGGLPVWAFEGGEWVLVKEVDSQ